MCASKSVFSVVMKVLSMSVRCVFMSMRVCSV